MPDNSRSTIAWSHVSKTQSRGISKIVKINFALVIQLNVVLAIQGCSENISDYLSQVQCGCRTNAVLGATTVHMRTTFSNIGFTLPGSNSLHT